MDETELRQFTGTEQHHKLSVFAKFVCTDGVKYVAEEGKAYWLIDAIASYQPKFKELEFQIWFFEKNKIGNGGRIWMQEDTGAGHPILVEQEIPYTDFPLAKLKLYLSNGVLMLPSEY